MTVTAPRPLSVHLPIQRVNPLLHRLTYEGRDYSVTGLNRMCDVGEPPAAKLFQLVRGDELQVRRAGEHLWNQLRLPPSVAELTLESEDDEILSLPWNALWHDGQWLVHRGLVVRCVHPGAPRERNLSRSLELVVALPSLSAATASQQSVDWEMLWQELGWSPERLAFSDTPDEFLAQLRNRADVAYLPLREGYQRGGPLLLDAYELLPERLEEALGHSPPQILLLGGPGVEALRFSGLLATLAARVPCLVLIPDSKEDKELKDGAAARRFLELLLKGHSPARACHELARPRAPSKVPLCIGGKDTFIRQDGPTWSPREPLDGNPQEKPSWDDDWEVELDRSSQVGQFVSKLSKLRKKGGCALVLWHGPTAAGIKRLHGRFFKAVREDNVAIRELALGWSPANSPTDSDFAGLYQQALGAKSLEPAELSAALRRLLPELSLDGSASPILYAHHDVLSATLYPRRLNGGILQGYLRWWTRTFPRCRPPKATLVLSLAITLAPEAEWLEELENVVKDLRADLDGDIQLVPLGMLGDVTEGDVLDFLRQFMGGVITDKDDRRAVASEIIALTGGVYELVIRELEHVDRNWSALRDAWKARQGRRNGR